MTAFSSPVMQQGDGHERVTDVDTLFQTPWRMSASATARRSSHSRKCPRDAEADGAAGGNDVGHRSRGHGHPKDCQKPKPCSATIQFGPRSTGPDRPAASNATCQVDIERTASHTDP